MVLNVCTSRTTIFDAPALVYEDEEGDMDEDGHGHGGIGLDCRRAYWHGL